jgi:hypothetical protein
MTQGLGNCSACNIGALVQVQTITAGNFDTQSIGICQLCPTGCNSCTYALIEPGFSAPINALNCTSCASLYVYNFETGGCTPCPANCLACSCQGDSCATSYCLTCATGYTNKGPAGCVASTTAAE